MYDQQAWRQPGCHHLNFSIFELLQKDMTKSGSKEDDICARLSLFFHVTLFYFAKLTPFFLRLESYQVKCKSILPQIHTAAQDIFNHLAHIETLTPNEALYFFLALLLDIDDSLAPFGKDSFSKEEQLLCKTLAGAIGRNYKGAVIEHFINFVKTVDKAKSNLQGKHKRPYHKGTSIVQSSGTGKTRLVLEVGNTRAPLLYLCAHPIMKLAKLGYPLSNSKIINFLTSTLPNTKGFKNNKRAAIFLAAWFNKLSDRLAPLPTNDAKEQYLCQLNDFCQGSPVLLCTSFFNTIAERTLALINKGPHNSKDHAIIFRNCLFRPMVCLSKQLKTVAHPSGGTVYVAFDKCVNINGYLMDSIRSAWAYLTNLQLEGTSNEVQVLAGVKGCAKGDLVCFWLLLLSTSSSATFLICPCSDLPSKQESLGTPLPIFTRVGFDVLQAKQLLVTQASEAVDINHIKYYGRPLWISLVKAKLWSTAVDKLLNGSDFKQEDQYHCFNILASCLALHYVPTIGQDSSIYGQQTAFARVRVSNCV